MGWQLRSKMASSLINTRAALVGGHEFGKKPQPSEGQAQEKEEWKHGEATQRSVPIARTVGKTDSRIFNNF